MRDLGRRRGRERGATARARELGERVAKVREWGSFVSGIEIEGCVSLGFIRETESIVEIISGNDS